MGPGRLRPAARSCAGPRPVRPTSPAPCGRPPPRPCGPLSSPPRAAHVLPAPAAPPSPPAQPHLVVSPWATPNFIDDTITDHSSILRFVEDNWNLGQIGNGSTDAIAGPLNNMFDFNDGPQAHRLLLDPQSGQRLED